LAQKRGTLSSKIPTSELTHAFNKAAALMRPRKKRVMTSEMLLLAFAKTPEVEAYRMLQNFSQERGFNWDNFIDDLDRAAGDKVAADMRFDFVTDHGDRISLADELLTVLDEGLTLAENRGGSQCGSVHALAVMSTIKIATHWSLNRRGITQQSILKALENPSVVRGGARAIDHVTLAQKGQLAPIFQREDLLRNLLNLLSMIANRHVILTGEPGVGKRSLVLSLAKLIADGNGLGNVKSVVQMNEPALIDDPYAAVQAGLRMAKGGILFVPDIVRFFGGPRLHPDFPDRQVEVGSGCGAFRRWQVGELGTRSFRRE